ncbi:MAG: NAD(P)/FAD-dependent oxidoreductase, partial [Chloroflexota bacterium]|nr:NAD(P)/FAD-dependent oxidoreductase [Chloroflexota bacterium]
HVRIASHKVEQLEPVDGGFQASGQFGTALGRAVILAMGVLDHYPHFEDWQSYVGVSMFWCIACDGYESRGKKVVIAGNTNDAVTEAMQLTRLTDDITFLTNSQTNEIDEQYGARLARARISFIHDKISEVEGASGQLRCLITNGGLRVPLEALFVVQGATVQNELAKMLELELSEQGYIVVDTEQKTRLPGVFAAGDITQLHAHQISAAVHEGAQAACAANYYLYPSELKDD